jgi:hypothetical protein
MDPLGRDHARLSGLAASGLSRQSLLRVAGTLEIAGLASWAVPAGAAAGQSTYGSPTMGVGSDEFKGREQLCE